MMHNLEAEMARQKIKKKDLAEAIDVTDKSLWNKLNGVTEFKRSEILAIRDTFFPEMELEYLFEKEEQ